MTSMSQSQQQQQQQQQQHQSTEEPCETISLTDSTTDMNSNTNIDAQNLITSCRLQSEANASETWYEQNEVEQRIESIRQAASTLSIPLNKQLNRQHIFKEQHVKWLLKNLKGIPRGYSAYDSLQPWLAFWIVHSLNLLKVDLPQTDKLLIIDRLKMFQSREHGAFTGGIHQPIEHLASTFAAVMALISLGNDEALQLLHESRHQIIEFIKSMKQQHDGSFLISNHGEADSRSLYCAVSVYSILKTNTNDDQFIFQHIESYLKNLQAFDGGLGGEVGTEAHGGNTYCALAAAKLANCLNDSVLDMDQLTTWIVSRQMNYEGGFQGRTNKLVDSCYSFWIGSLFPMLNIQHLVNAQHVCQYVVQCCQLPNGGFRDKPGTNRDLMHTCYSLSGLSVALHYCRSENDNDDNDDFEIEDDLDIDKVDVVYNVTIDKLQKARQFLQAY